MKLYLRYASIILRSQMQHKGSFVMMTLGQLIVSFSAFIGIYFMFSRFNSVSGFSFAEVLLCFSVVLMGFALAEMFARGFDMFSVIISNAEFDRMMVRPRNEMLQVLASRIELSRLGRLLQAVLMLCYALPYSGVNWTADKIFVLVLMIIGGVCVFAGLFIVYASICFFTLEGLEFMNVLTDGGREFGRYPFSIYGDSILKFFTYVVPIACVQYYPLLYLLGRTSSITHMLSPIAGILFLVPAYAFWRYGVRRYKSVGS